MTSFAPPRGTEAISAAAASSSDFAPTRKIEYLDGLQNDGDSVVVRFLTELHQMPVVSRHDYIPTKAAPAGAGNGWPGSMPAVCRKDAAFGTSFDGCYICDFQIPNKYDPGKPNKAVKKTWAIACVRTNVGPNGEKLAAYTDKPRTVKVKADNGEIIERIERSLVVVCQGSSNFWKNLLTVAGRNGGIVCNRDYEIVRQGKGKDTQYMFFAHDVDQVLHPDNTTPGQVSWDNYLKAIAAQGYILDDIIVNGASDAYYAKFFDPRFTVAEDGTVVAVQGAGAAPAAAASVQDKIAQLQGSFTAVPAASWGGEGGGDPWGL